LANPEIIQVADCFHLVCNVGAALKELLRSQRWEWPTDGRGASAGCLGPIGSRPWPSHSRSEAPGGHPPETGRVGGGAPVPPRWAIVPADRANRGPGSSDGSSLPGARRALGVYASPCSPDATYPIPGLSRRALDPALSECTPTV
jgi:hypothetical protein